MLLADNKSNVEEITPIEKKKQDFNNVGEVIKHLPDHSLDQKPVTSPTTSKAGKSRGKYKKAEPDPESMPQKEHVKTFLEFINVILKKFKIEELDKSEITDGVTSLYPLYRTMFPRIGGQSIYFAPVAWGSGVLISRIDFIKNFGKKDPSADGETVKDQPVMSEPGVSDWSKSEQPGTAEAGIITEVKKKSER